MVGNPVLRVIIGSYLLAAVAMADFRQSFLPLFLQLLLEQAVIEACLLYTSIRRV